MQLNITNDQSSPITIYKTVVADQIIVSKFYLGTFPFIGSYDPSGPNLSLPAKNCIPSNEKI
jgi:hypothetical protein